MVLLADGSRFFCRRFRFAPVRWLQADGDAADLRCQRVEDARADQTAQATAEAAGEAKKQTAENANRITFDDAEQNAEQAAAADAAAKSGLEDGDRADAGYDIVIQTIHPLAGVS